MTSSASPDRMAGRILDMGDILTLIEQAEKKMDAEEAEKVASKALAGQLTLADFLSQLQQIKKLGSMKKMLGMIPGAAQLRDQIENFDEREVDRVEAIVRSMTPAGRARTCPSSTAPAARASPAVRVRPSPR